MTARPLAALAWAATSAAAPPAWGYVRERTPENCPTLSDDPVMGCVEVAWPKAGTNCIPITVYLNGFTQMTPDEVTKSIGAAAHTWSPSSVECPGATAVTRPFLEIVPGIAPISTAPPPVANDAHTVAVFRADFPPEEFMVIANTTLWKKGDGRIVDADIDINMRDFDFGNLDPGHGFGGNGQPLPVDLQAAITHEFGHLLGLGHTCFLPGGSDLLRPQDHDGNPVPDCLGAPPEVAATVMAAEVPRGDVHQRVLTADDIAGVCAIYPEADDPRICRLDLPDDGCGCATGGGGDGAVPIALALALAIRALLTSGRAR